MEILGQPSTDHVPIDVQGFLPKSRHSAGFKKSSFWELVTPPQFPASTATNTISLGFTGCLSPIWWLKSPYNWWWNSPCFMTKLPTVWGLNCTVWCLFGTHKFSSFFNTSAAPVAVHGSSPFFALPGEILEAFGARNAMPATTTWIAWRFWRICGRLWLGIDPHEPQKWMEMDFFCATQIWFYQWKWIGLCHEKLRLMLLFLGYVQAKWVVFGMGNNHR